MILLHLFSFEVKHLNWQFGSWNSQH